MYPENYLIPMKLRKGEVLFKIDPFEFEQDLIRKKQW